MEPPDCLSTISPYQLPLILLLLNDELLACCPGTLEPELASRKRTPTVQLSTTAFCVSTKLSVLFRKIIPVRLLVITLLIRMCPLVSFRSIPVRLPSNQQLRI